MSWKRQAVIVDYAVKEVLNAIWKSYRKSVLSLEGNIFKISGTEEDGEC